MRKITGTCKCGSTNIKEEHCQAKNREYVLYKCQDCKLIENADGFGVPEKERRLQWTR